MEQQAKIPGGLADRVFANLAPHVLENLSAEQKDAIIAAAHEVNLPMPPQRAVNIRLSLPLVLGRYYLTVLAGRERRTPERVSAERSRHPLATAGNAVFLGLVTSLTAIGAIAVASVAILIYSSVLVY